MLEIIRMRFMNPGWNLALVAFVLVAGCGEKTGTISITGKVTYKDKPVVNARVLLSPVKGGRPADGMTNADGTVRFGTYQAGDGVLPGEYRVTVAANGEDVSKPPSTEITDGSAYEPINPDSTKSTIPAKYLSPTSGLKAIVEDGGPKEFEFKLTD